jgi:hypothetical protein
LGTARPRRSITAVTKMIPSRLIEKVTSRLHAGKREKCS